MIDDELERFKTLVNLSEFAASRGFKLDRRESSRNSAVMRHPDGDKIIIARNDMNTNWIFFSVRDDQENGTIIDFIQRREGGNLGEVRKILRRWLGSSRPVVHLPLFVQDLEPVSRNRIGVIAAWERAERCLSLPYLTARGLSPELLSLSIFANCVRVDRRNNAIFPHYDKSGLCGFEIKNNNFTGFAAGGVKGLWFSQANPTDKELVLTESAIDALSYHALHKGNCTRYMSTGGALNPQQPDLIRGAIEKLPVGAVVMLAFDNDEGGNKIAAEIKAVAPACREIRRVLPDKMSGKDWNEILKIQRMQVMPLPLSCGKNQ
jgi:hypothetical protein